MKNFLKIKTQHGTFLIDAEMDYIKKEDSGTWIKFFHYKIPNFEYYPNHQEALDIFKKYKAFV